MYKIIRPLLFLLDPEKIHTLIFGVLRVVIRIPGCQSLLKLLFRYENPALHRSLLGLTFMNPVGLAAGFDKDAKLIDALSCFGFGFIEIGTVTPKGQPGNPKPRLFRLPADHALSNRMGFNNEGASAAVERLKKRRGSVIIGGNIGKNKSTPNEFAHEDYIFCFNALYEHVDYFVVNVSSPNTPGLRELQEKEPLTHLLTTIKELSNSKPLARPVLLKIAPDLSPGQLDDIVAILKATGVEGVIATNTTVSRDHLTTEPAELARVGAGGISGRPLASRSTEIIRHLRTAMGKDFPIIGVGGIMSPADALDKLEAGADLIQIYTGFIYEGPGFVKRLNEAIAKRASHSLKVQGHFDVA